MEVRWPCDPTVQVKSHVSQPRYKWCQHPEDAWTYLTKLNKVPFFTFLSWPILNWCFWTVVLEKTLQSPLDCKEIKPVSPKGNKPWIFIGRTEAEALILWPPDGKSRLIGKDPDARKDWRQEKRTTEDEMVGWHHQLNGHEFAQTEGDSEGQGSLAYCSPWGHKESNMTEWQNNNDNLDCSQSWVSERDSCFSCTFYITAGAWRQSSLSLVYPAQVSVLWKNLPVALPLSPFPAGSLRSSRLSKTRRNWDKAMKEEDCNFFFKWEIQLHGPESMENMGHEVPKPKAKWCDLQHNGYSPGRSTVLHVQKQGSQFHASGNWGWSVGSGRTLSLMWASCSAGFELEKMQT